MWAKGRVKRKSRGFPHVEQMTLRPFIFFFNDLLLYVFVHSLAIVLKEGSGTFIAQSLRHASQKQCKTWFAPRLRHWLSYA